MAEVPEEVHIRPFPHEGYERGFRMDCPHCAKGLWIEGRQREADPFEPTPCPECRQDIRMALSVALSDGALRHLRGRSLHVSERPT